MQDNTPVGGIDRRSFLKLAGRATGSIALVGAYPVWRHWSATPDAFVRRKSWAMGTEIHLTVPASTTADEATRAAFASLTRIQDRLSAHDPASALSALNTRVGRWLDVDEDLAEVAGAARRFAELTDGAMDVTVLPAMRAYGFMPGAVDGSYRDRIGIEHLRTDGRRARLDQGGYAVDFGGIAKGHGVDRGIDALRGKGEKAALLEAGGDLYAMSRPEANRLWSVGIRDPRRVDRIMARFDVEDEAVATSGTYFQKRIVDGREVSHLIDPRTGNPVGHVLSATVLAPDAMTADALATAACVLPTTEALRLYESLPGIEALWIPADGEIVMTIGLRNRVRFV